MAALFGICIIFNNQIVIFSKSLKQLFHFVALIHGF